MILLYDHTGGVQHTSIELQTRLGNDIDNVQPWTYSAFEWSQLCNSVSQFELAGAERVSEACPVYNCHGLTFGSRRTQVSGASAVIDMILEDDGFVQIPELSVRTGDVVVYYGPDGDVWHSGIVLRRGASNIPVIWSKWGKGFEWVHLLGNCPFDPTNTRFYRITKWKPEDILKKS